MLEIKETITNIFGNTPWDVECYEKIKKIHKILGRRFKVKIKYCLSPTYLVLDFPEDDQYKIPSSLPLIRTMYGDVEFGTCDDANPGYVHLDNHISSLRCYNMSLSDKQKVQLSELGLTTVIEKI